MSHERSVSRRASLKNLGAAGALLLLERGASAADQAGTAAQSAPVAQKTDVAELAVSRFAKGHS